MFQWTVESLQVGLEAFGHSPGTLKSRPRAGSSVTPGRWCISYPRSVKAVIQGAFGLLGEKLNLGPPSGHLMLKA